MPCTPERVWKAIRDASANGNRSAEGLGGDAPRDASGQPHFDPGSEENADPGATGGSTGSTNDGGGAQ
jgi:carbon-monoxide dehydrogenase large subunit